jgi:hypothetical protein
VPELIAPSFLPWQDHPGTLVNLGRTTQGFMIAASAKDPDDQITLLEILYAPGVVITSAANETGVSTLWHPGSGTYNVYARATSADGAVHSSATVQIIVENDSDGDGLGDGFEAIAGSDILPDSDDDGDGLTNIEEFFNYLNPTDGLDYDGDGMPDDWECYYGLNEDNPSENLPTSDPDGDGFDNATEFLDGTNPRDPDSHACASRSRTRYACARPCRARRMPLRKWVSERYSRGGPVTLAG